MKQVNVGVIGFGTVGAGTVEILFSNRDVITSRVGSDIVVKKIADLDISSDRGISIPLDLLTTDAKRSSRTPRSISWWNLLAVLIRRRNIS